MSTEEKQKKRKFSIFQTDTAYQDSLNATGKTEHCANGESLNDNDKMTNNSNNNNKNNSIKKLKLPNA